MIRVSRAFRRELAKNNRNYRTYATITLVDGSQTVLSLHDEELWVGGFSRETAVSEDDNFTALGSTIVGSASITINNIDEQYSDYDFKGAHVALSLGLMVSGQLEQIRMGTYYVDETHYNGSTITLEMLDAMHKFDQPYIFSTLTYPATIGEIIRDACTECGVTLTTQDFPHRDYEIAKRPEEESVTYREVLGWATAIAGCFARINNLGYLEIKWFDTATLETWNEGWDGGTFDSSKPYSTGDSVEGGSFNPWNEGTAYDGEDFQVEKAMHVISGLYSQNISMDDVVITGVGVTVKNDDEDDPNETIDYKVGDLGYLIHIEGNELLTPANGQEVCTWLADQLIGLRFRKASVTHANDPSIEAGDIAVLYDRKDRPHPILVTRSNFSVGNVQTTVCGAETPLRNQSRRYSWETKSYVAARKIAKEQMTAWEAAEAALVERLDNAAGLFCTPKTDTATGATKLYYHDKADLDDSDIVMLFTDTGFTLTNNYQAAKPTWYGMTVDGTFISAVMNTIGLNFEWGTGGLLTLGGQNNVNGHLRMLDASGTQIGAWNKDGIQITKGQLNIGSGKFVVTTAGKMTAVDGDFSGKITSKTGNIGGMVIEEDYIASNTSGWKTLTDFLTSLTPHNNSNVYDTYIGKGGIAVGNKVKSSTLSNGRLTLVSNATKRGYIGMPSDTGLARFGIWYVSPSYESDLNVNNATFVIENAMSTEGNKDVNHASFNGSIWVGGKFSCAGTKSRIADTDDYGKRLLYCYEMASPVFGDLGEGTIGEDGLCYVQIDPVFSETVNTKQYQVFLQAYGEGECYTMERRETYFVVKGTPGLSFGWEIKAKQSDYDQNRLETWDKGVTADSIDYAYAATEHISGINAERMSA